ncbi:hypothetical protein, partial [Albidovulum sp.]|uniref:hypothetical protein n=1 Tax=Albidovulum sp. TaxID=1872424 RepID=UPI0039B856C9
APRRPICSVCPSKGPNRPHISSVTSDFKERERQNQPVAPYLLGATARSFLVFVRLPGVTAASVCRCSVTAASVKGYLRIGAGVRKSFFRE